MVGPPQSAWPSTSMGISFLYNPALNLGNSQTWLVGTDNTGLWRTTDSGATFVEVTPYYEPDGAAVYPNFSITHGGQQIYYANNGYIYTGLFVYPARSTDNGVTWQFLPNFPWASYYSVYGDGNTLYTQLAFTGDNNGQGLQPYPTSRKAMG